MQFRKNRSLSKQEIALELSINSVQFIYQIYRIILNYQFGNTFKEPHQLLLLISKISAQINIGSGVQHHFLL